MGMGNAFISGLNAGRVNRQPINPVSIANMFPRSKVRIGPRAPAQQGFSPIGDEGTEGPQASSVPTPQQQATIASRAESDETNRIKAEEQRRAGEFERAQKSDQAAMTKDEIRRREAFRGVMVGLAARDPQMLSENWRKLIPSAEDLDISKSGGVTKITDPNAAKEIPKFNFNEDGTVDVTFPGQDKPVQFKDSDEAFKMLVSPLNPQHEVFAPADAKVDASRAAVTAEGKFKGEQERGRQDRMTERVKGLSSQIEGLTKLRAEMGYDKSEGGKAARAKLDEQIEGLQKKLDRAAGGDSSPAEDGKGATGKKPLTREAVMEAYKESGGDREKAKKYLREKGFDVDDDDNDKKKKKKDKDGAK